MPELTKEEALTLDKISEYILKNGTFSELDCPVEGVNLKDKSEYSIYLQFLSQQCFFSNTSISNNTFQVKPISSKLSEFLQNGGFEKVYEEQQKVKNRTVQKEIYSLKLAKLKVWTFWPLFVIAVFGGVYSGMDLLNKNSKHNVEEEYFERIRQMESKITSLQIMISAQINPISSNSIKNEGFKLDSLRNNAFTGK